MPQRPLHAFQLLLNAGPTVLIEADQPFDVLPQNGHAHGHVKPIDQMLRLRMELHGEVPHRLAPIGQEGERLIVLHALRLQYLAQPAFRFGVVGLDKAKAFGRLGGRHRFADNDLEVALLLIPVSDIPAIETNGDGLLEVRRQAAVTATAVHTDSLFLSHLEEQLGRSGLGEERGQWPERGRRAGLTPTVVETRTGEDYRTKEGAYGAGRLFLDLKGRAAGRALGAGG